MSSDIDFDELDKAVSSLMGGVGTEKTDEAPKQKTLTISDTLQPGEDPAYTKLDEVARSIGNETFVTDGEKTVDVDEVPQNTPPQTISQQPVQPVAPVQTPASEPAVSTGPVLPPSPAVQRPATGRFMDVVHPSSAMRGAATLDATPPIRTTSPPIAPTAEAPQGNPDVPLTPFLPDAKVEKRPLGGSGAIPSPFDDEPVDVAAQKTEPQVEETTAINSEPQGPRKDDLQPVLDASTYDQEDTSESAEIAAVESTEVKPEAPATQSGSIASVESGDTEHLKNPQTEQQGAIYDVDNQPQALAHPAKQKSGWGTVIVIVIIIILAAAVGAAAYFILGLGV